MTDNIIQLNKSDIVSFKIYDENGNDTGNTLEFNLNDTHLLLRLQELVEKDKKNRSNLRNQFVIIDKKEDLKGKKLLSSKEEAKLKALEEFFDNEIEVYNMFLGENGVQKLLNGRAFEWTTLREIDEIIEKHITPKLNISMDNIEKKIMDKYSIKKEDLVIE